MHAKLFSSVPEPPHSCAGQLEKYITMPTLSLPKKPIPRLPDFHNHASLISHGSYIPGQLMDAPRELVGVSLYTNNTVLF